MKHSFLKMAGMKDEKSFYDKYPTEEHFFKDYPNARMQQGGYTSKSGIKVSYDNTPDWFHEDMFNSPIPRVPMAGGTPLPQPQPQQTIPVPPMAQPGRGVSYEHLRNSYGTQYLNPVFEGPWNQAEIQAFTKSQPFSDQSGIYERGQGWDEMNPAMRSGGYVGNDGKWHVSSESGTYSAGTYYQTGGLIGDIDEFHERRDISKGFRDQYNALRQNPKYPFMYEQGQENATEAIPQQLGNYNDQLARQKLQQIYNTMHKYAGSARMALPENFDASTADLTNFDYKKKGGHWIQGAVNPDHKGWCTPISNPHCTGHRRAFALMMKKKHGFHQEGGQSSPTILDSKIVNGKKMYLIEE